MPRSNDDSPRRRRKDRYRSEDRSRSSSRGHRDSRERDRHRKKDSRSKRRSISNDRKKSYDRSPTSYQSTSSHRSKRRSASRHRSKSRHSSRTDYKKSRHRRERSSSSSSSSSSSTTSCSKSRSRKRSSSSDDVKVIEPTLSKEINLDSATNEEKRRQLIDEIDADSFVPKTFSSNTTKKISDKVIIDLQKETISIPKVEKVNSLEDEIIHPNFLGNDEERMEKWIRKLYVYRQKYFDE